VFFASRSNTLYFFNDYIIKCEALRYYLDCSVTLCPGRAK